MLDELSVAMCLECKRKMSYSRMRMRLGVYILREQPQLSTAVAAAGKAWWREVRTWRHHYGKLTIHASSIAMAGTLSVASRGSSRGHRSRLGTSGEGSERLALGEVWWQGRRIE